MTKVASKFLQLSKTDIYEDRKQTHSNVSLIPLRVEIRSSTAVDDILIRYEYSECNYHIHVYLNFSSLSMNLNGNTQSSVRGPKERYL